MLTLIEYTHPTLTYTTPCGRLTVRYYRDIRCPDERSVSDDLVLTLSAPLTTSARTTLHICDPSLDGFSVIGFKVTIATTPIPKLRAALLDLPRYDDLALIRARYDTEMTHLRNQGRTPTGQEPWFLSHVAIQARFSSESTHRSTHRASILKQEIASSLASSLAEQAHVSARRAASAQRRQRERDAAVREETQRKIELVHAAREAGAQKRQGKGKGRADSGAGRRGTRPRAGTRTTDEFVRDDRRRRTLAREWEARPEWDGLSAWEKKVAGGKLGEDVGLRYVQH
ncbi:Hypothetical protein D9617_5g070010 [Elsinoe fawcettii]|nr:Hypothetical protein D9617_5g070010 [Elsinoe fawcettii]